jgi:hypothetical protein
MEEEPTCDVFLQNTAYVHQYLIHKHTQRLLWVKTGRVPRLSSGYASKKPNLNFQIQIILFYTGTT